MFKLIDSLLNKVIKYCIDKTTNISQTTTSNGQQIVVNSQGSYSSVNGDFYYNGKKVFQGDPDYEKVKKAMKNLDKEMEELDREMKKMSEELDNMFK